MADLSKILSVNNKETDKTLKSIDTGMKALIKITLKGQKEEAERGKKEEQQRKRQERRSPAAAIKIDKTDKKKEEKKEKKPFLDGLKKFLNIFSIGGALLTGLGAFTKIFAIGGLLLKGLGAFTKIFTIGGNLLKGLGSLGGLLKVSSPLMKGLTALSGIFTSPVLAALAGGLALKGMMEFAKWAGGVGKSGIKNKTSISDELEFGKGSSIGARIDADKEAPGFRSGRGAVNNDYRRAGGGNEATAAAGLRTAEDRDRMREVYSQLLRDIKTEEDKEINKFKNDNKKTIGTGRGKKTVPNYNQSDITKIESKYEEKRQQLLKNYVNTFGKLGNEQIQTRQNGGPITVPGTGSGDKVPMMLQPGSFVLNRNASNFLRRQTGGEVPTMLEPGELVYLNENIQRFQTGGQVSHQDTGSGYQPGNAKDSNGRPVVLSKGAADAFEKMMKDGGVKGSDVASSKRSPSKNAAVGGVPNSAHLGGNAIDIHGASKSWMISNSDKYGWKRNNYMADSWHWDYVGKGSGSGVNEGNDNKSGNKKSAKNGISKVIDAIGGGDMLAGLGGAAAAMALQAMGVNLFGGANPAVIGAIMGPALLGTITDLGKSLFGGGGAAADGESSGDAGSGANGVSSKNAKALLNAIADAEGTSKYANQGYNTMFTGKQFSGDNHPRQINSGGGYSSDAAGRYQFLSTTWDEYSNGRNMSPNNQDLVAMDLVRKKRGVNLSDGLSLAETYKLGQEWASIEGGASGTKGGSYGGQAKFSAKKFMSMYKGYGGALQLQKGGAVPTMLEPGEMVFPSTTSSLKQLNSAVPRFQNGGSVMDPDSASGMTPQVIVVQAPSVGGGNNGQSANNVQTPTAPALSNGPTMASISDIINRVSWSNVF